MNIMPKKFKPSATKYVNGVKRQEHTYMSGVSTQTLKDELEKNNTTPKFKDKIMKELVKRGAV